MSLICPGCMKAVGGQSSQSFSEYSACVKCGGRSELNCVAHHCSPFVQSKAAERFNTHLDRVSGNGYAKLSHEGYGYYFQLRGFEPPDRFTGQVVGCSSPADWDSSPPMPDGTLVEVGEEKLEPMDSLPAYRSHWHKASLAQLVLKYARDESEKRASRGDLERLAETSVQMQLDALYMAITVWLERVEAADKARTIR